MSPKLETEQIASLLDSRMLMSEKPQIIRVIGRAEQGATRPYLCEADDGCTYFVKGEAAGMDGLVAEWVAGTLGRKFGLAVPEFRTVRVPPELIAADLTGNLGELGAGVWFGSRLVEGAIEFRPVYAGQVPEEMRARVLLWDWWISNGDRWVDPGGRSNPNLLWTPDDANLHVFDHNLAFIPESRAGFRHRHIFRESQDYWTLDYRANLLDEMRKALEGFDVAWASMPAEWVAGVVGNSRENLFEILWRFEADLVKFWNLS